jgi:peptide-methionine (S)-S-oxide reductase
MSEIGTGKEIATLGGGCFWCLEAVYDQLEGVESVESGYMGGHVENPTYDEICDGESGHAEVVRVTFDPEVISYRDLLEIFFAIHDPTTPNRQGHDIGTQYRSAIFYHSEEQRRTAEAVIREAQPAWPNRIVTEVTPASTFYEADAAHQEYWVRNRYNPYCVVVIDPKVAKVRQHYAARLKR